jgi:hypothetical protein
MANCWKFCLAKYCETILRLRLNIDFIVPGNIVPHLQKLLSIRRRGNNLVCIRIIGWLSRPRLIVVYMGSS